MNHLHAKLFGFAFLFVSTISLYAQPITGIKTVCASGCDYATLSLAVTALNLNGVGTGGAIIEVSNGHTETLPNAGISLGSATLNGTLAANRSLIIRKSTLPGAKPVFTSGVGTGGIDAMFRMLGADFVTIEELVFNENNSNTTSTTQYEYGIMLVKRNTVNPVDGCQNNTIKNCEITFRRGGTLTQTGIYAANHLANNTSNITYTLTSDAHSFNTIEGNTITNGQHGIYFAGINSPSAAIALYDQSNIIGTATNGNIVRRFGSNNNAIATGIIAYYQNNLLIEGNTISGGGTNFTSTLNGIDLQRILRGTVRLNTITDTSLTGTNNGIFINGSNTRLFIDSNFILNGLSMNGILNGINAISSDTLFITANSIAGNRYLGNAQGAITGVLLTYVQNKFSALNRNLIYENYSNNSFYGINLFGSQGIGRVFNNKIYSNTCLNGQHVGIFNNQNSNQPDSVINNEIYNLVNLVNGSVIGYLKPVTGTTNTGVKFIQGNSIYNLRTKLGFVKAIEYNNSNAQINISRNKIFGFRSDSINVTLTGIEIGSNASNVNIFNNLIYDFETYNSPIVANMFGIYINNSASNNISRLYHNTVFFNAQNSGNLVSYCLRAGIFSLVEIRNNIFVNKSLATINGFNAAYYREGSNLATYRVGSNHNLFYASGTPGRFALYFDAVAIDSTLLQLKNRLSPRESESYYEDVAFQLVQPNVLAPLVTVPTQVESGGNYIDTPFVIQTDINGVMRSNRYPDIGCYEGVYMPADINNPTITYAPIRGVSPYQTVPQVRVFISDRFGIKVATATRPRLYFKKKTDANVFVANSAANGGWKFVLTNDTVSPFKFDINYNLLQGALLPGDTIQFFATAEDSNANIGAGSVILAGNPMQTTLSSVNFPVSGQINFIPVFDTLSGVFTVGVGGNFNSITAALKRFEASVQTGPVTFLLINPRYSTSAFGGLETFPLSLNPSIGMSVTNNLLIKPAAGVNVHIFGIFDSALFVVRDGVNGFTFDGSNGSANTRNVTIQNTHSNAQSVVLIQSNNSSGGIKNVTLKSLNLKGASINTTQIIIIGARTGIGAQAIVKSSGADRISIVNCNLYSGLAGIMAVGSAENPITNLLIEQNRFSTDSANLLLAGTGIYLEGCNAAIVNKNAIVNLFTQFVQLVSAIHINERVTNSTIKNNIIHNIESANNNSTGSFGIFISSGVGVNNDSIYNNSISRIIASSSGSSFGNVFNTFGIKIEGGTALKIFYNSVHLTGNSNFGSGPNGSGAIQIFGNGPFTGLEIRNNVFSNRMLNNLSGSRQAAIWASTTLPIAGAVINHNNYFVNGFGGTLLYDGTSNYNNMADLRTVLGGNINSIAVDPLFISSSNLRPTKGGLLRTGAVIFGINTDILDSLRLNTQTRLGCYENEYDLNPPIFGLHQNATNSGASPFRDLLPVVITDTLSGINLANGKRPRVYFKKKSEGNGFGLNQSSFNGWKFVETSSITSPFLFTLNYNLLTSLPVIGDSIFYFFTATDSSGNFTSLPGAGFSGISYDSLVNPPVNPFRFRIISAPMIGTYTVGLGGNYSSLTAAVTDVNQRGVSGAVTLLLTQANYTTPSEIFPIVFSNGIQGVSALNTVSIRPANGIAASITGSGTPALLQLNGCSFINIVGTDTITNSGRKITIRNSVSNPSILIENDASFNQIKNCQVFGETFFNSDGIIKFGNRISTGNDNNVIDSCLIGSFTVNARPAVCISSNATNGAANVLSGFNTISNNEIFNPNNFGVLIDNFNEHFIITGNSFYKNATYIHSGNFSFIGYYANGGNIANNFFGGSAANAAGLQQTVFDGTSGTFSLINLMGSNINVVKNTFRRIQFNGLFNNFNHAFIGVLNGKMVIQENVIGNDTGQNSIQLNYTNTVGSAGISAINIGNGQGTALDSIQLFGNRIGAIQAIGGGLLNLYGIRFNASSGTFIVRQNLIGSNQTLASINQLCNGDLMGIEFTVNNGQHVLIENNTISNLRYSLHHTKVLTGLFYSGNTPAIIRKNRIQQLFHAPINAALINTSFNYINGIFVSTSGSGQRLISDNTINQIYTNSNPSGFSNGMQISGSNIQVIRNSITGVGPLLPVEARATGILLFGAGMQIINNEIVLGVDSLFNAITGNTAYYGILKNGALNKIFHNSVFIGGNNVVNTGTNFSAAYFSQVGDVQDSVFNNIFLNQRSNTTASGGKHYAVYFWLGSNPIMNNNLLFANGNNGFIGNANATDYNTLNAFSTATNTNNQSRSKPVFFEAAWRLRLASSSLGDTSLAGIPLTNVGTDIDLQLRDWRKPYMGCDESPANPLPVELLLFEVNVNGIDANIRWQTAQEFNNNGFYLQRSFDGILFEPIAFYKGGGNSSVILKYHHEDENVLQQNKQVYYKLLQQDFNGTVNDLGTRLIYVPSDVSISIFPNPVNDKLQILCNNSNCIEKLSLLDMSGNTVLGTSNTVLLDEIHANGLDLNDLASGLYVLKLVVNGKDVIYKVVVK